MVDTRRIFANIEGLQASVNTPLLRALKQIQTVQVKPFADLSRSLTANLPKFHLDLPALSIDYARLFGPAVNLHNLELYRTVDTSSLNAFSKIYEEQRKLFEKSFDTSTFRRLIDSLYPPNWRGVTRGSESNLEVLLLDEGLALGWVPEATLLQRLFDASSRQERRRLIGRNWKRVMKSCRAELESVNDSELASYRDFALKAVDAIESGMQEAGQALAANLLDTMLRETLDGADRKLVTNQKNRLNIDDLPIRARIVFGGIWGSFTEFWTNQGDPVPRDYSRHASVHAVGKRQYSRINAVIAVMHVTAYVKLLESGDLNP